MILFKLGVWVRPENVAIVTIERSLNGYYGSDVGAVVKCIVQHGMGSTELVLMCKDIAKAESEQTRFLVDLQKELYRHDQP